jgi:hypothetical protein
MGTWMSETRGIGGHQKAYRGRSDDWLTPPELVDALGPFDLDPCASAGQPWRTAATQYEDGGLEREWFGFVWCNPPYGPAVGKWMRRLADHGNGLGLIFARTETADFHEQVWQRADALLFFRGRLHFHHPVTGSRARHNAGGPSVLVAYGPDAMGRLFRLAGKTPGKLVMPR